MYREITPENTTPWTNAGLMLVHRLRGWTNIKPALVRGVVLGGIARIREIESTVE